MLNPSLKKLPFDPSLVGRMYTKSAYAEAFNVSRPTINKRIKDGEILAFAINGAEVILSKAA